MASALVGVVALPVSYFVKGAGDAAAWAIDHRVEDRVSLCWAKIQEWSHAQVPEQMIVGAATSILAVQIPCALQTPSCFARTPTNEDEMTIRNALSRFSSVEKGVIGVAGAVMAIAITMISLVRYRHHRNPNLWALMGIFFSMVALKPVFSRSSAESACLSDRFRGQGGGSTCQALMQNHEETISSVANIVFAIASLYLMRAVTRKPA